jgi:ParB family chromosome partitioning protein
MTFAAVDRRPTSGSAASTSAASRPPMSRKPALGRGLKALLPETPRPRAGLAELPVDSLQANPLQPRQHFEPDSLRGLATSITEHGVLQPLLVSDAGDGRYVILAGERRWRAAKIAGLRFVPAVVRERVDAAQELELALVENLQRRDLTPLEEARAYAHLGDAFGMSQADIAARVGVDRSTVANSLRLLKLPEDLQAMIELGKLTAGHGRALLAFADDAQRRHWAERAASAGLSVRDLERAAAEAGGRAARTRTRRPPDPNLREAEHRLSLRLGAKVEIQSRARGGRIVISCGDQEELMRVFDRLMEGD